MISKKESRELLEKTLEQKAYGMLATFEHLELKAKEFEESYAKTSKEFNIKMNRIKREQEKLMKELGGIF